MGPVLLLYVGIVVLLIRTAAGKLNVPPVAEGFEMVVNELASIVLNQSLSVQKVRLAESLPWRPAPWPDLYPLQHGFPPRWYGCRSGLRSG